jgi:hypothetical protein
VAVTPSGSKPTTLTVGVGIPVAVSVVENDLSHATLPDEAFVEKDGATWGYT